MARAVNVNLLLRIRFGSHLGMSGILGNLYPFLACREMHCFLGTRGGAIS